MRLAALVLVLVLAAPAAAWAGRVQVEPTRVELQPAEEDRMGLALTYAGTAGGERVTIEQDEDTTTVTDSGGIDAGPGCRRIAPDRAVCRGDYMERATVDLLDGDDAVEIERGMRYSATGGGGNDRLTGAQTMSGGPGDDVLRTGYVAGTLFGGSGADELVGGPGIADTVVYSGVTEPVHADLEGDADDGAAGEGDRIDPSVDRIAGGEAADVLVGDDRPNELHGGGGAGDRLVLGGGDDHGHAGPGDEVLGGPGRDIIGGGSPAPPGTPGLRADGGPGDDYVTDTPAHDRLTGGPGHDHVSAGRGDEIDLADGAWDDVTCNRPFRGAVVRLDGGDGVQGCPRETLVRRGTPRAAFVAAAASSVAAACPSDHGRPCRLRLRGWRDGRPILDRRLVLGARRPSKSFSFNTPDAGPGTVRFQLDTRDARGALRTQRVTVAEPPAPAPSARLRIATRSRPAGDDVPGVS